MHSGSFISPKHPAIPVSIGIASIVLEGRPAILDEGGASSGDSASPGCGPGGGGGGGASDEDGGFYGTATDHGKRYASSERATRESPLQMAECHKSFMSDAAQRINLKLQQIRSCPGSSKDIVENMVTVQASGSGARRGAVGDQDEYDGYGVETYVSEARGEASSLVFSAKAWSRDHIYSGFEKMKLLSAVSPIKAAATPFINFSPNVNSKKKSDAGISNTVTTKPRSREGPHCEQFLKKIGVIKTDPIEEAEHSCSYRNEFCLRWQAYFKQLSSILTSGDAICIEVFLGPENHAILLEQWILKLKIKSSESTMTLQSLCAAIRSQLYFSQISAWTDLIRNSLEPEIFNNPRIKKSSSGAPSGSMSSSSGSGEVSPPILPEAKLDILFRIRGYDNTACFNETPNVHNFPDAMIAGNYVIEVSLKSLPRLERIPRINDEMDAKMNESLVSDRIDLPCHEKGKHRCAFREEEEEDPQMGDDDLSSAAVSHREKQLIKYKKRMMKREKKKKTASSELASGPAESIPMVITPPVCKSPALNIPTVNHNSNCCVPPYTSSINLIQPPLYSNCDDLYQTAPCANNTKATQTAVFSSMSTGSNVTTVATQTDASGCCCLCSKEQPMSEPGKLMSTNSDSQMQYNNSNYNRDYPSDDCDTSQPEADVVVREKHQRENLKGLRKAELLLQAIQRTAIINDHQQPEVAHFKNNNYYSGSYNDNNNIGSDTAKCERSECDTFTFNKNALDLGDCRLCKRQKTKHNFKLALNESESSSTSSSTNNSPPGCRRTLSESLVGHFTIPSSPHYDETSTNVGNSNGHSARKDVNDLSAALSSSTGAIGNGAFSFEQLKSYRRAFSEDVIDTINSKNGIESTLIVDDGDDQEEDEDDDTFQKCKCPIKFSRPVLLDFPSRTPFVTPDSDRLQTSTPANSTSKFPLYVSCTENDCSVSTASSVSPHKKQILSCTAGTGNASQNKPSSPTYFTIPKINLSNIFNVSPLAREDSGFASSSSPIPIDGSVFNFTGSIDRLNVRKSNSAPTNHLSPGSLSPRFIRHSYKNQRTRHLSERSSFSERSSVGSDEHLSDDEFPYLSDSITTSSTGHASLGANIVPSSPLKFGVVQRPFIKSFSKNLFKFGRLPLLGTLEESLLQRRIAPKFQVADFKVLLGASGSFCPTQQTIPAVSYFYELPGQHLTTPYVCELRLPRKGYSVPRQGTVQVTLLNPLGTVVRMFVIPYDFRDMPAMSTTFIRQRILSYDDNSKDPLVSVKSVEELSNAEQMKLLRYAIHLRFQTSRSGKLSLHTDIRLLISRRTDCDTAAAHGKNLLEAPNELKVVTIVPENPKFSLRVDKQ
ncbi:protein Atossa [Topomyia yanbarensis]|uniref:protein Atossa n=1 Tax=Topomyia yanbarensis TaxID=2498891 RepID=UPI00273BD80D|nr:protein Atossa [Topomyia yanbarensis]XP_058816435.1 protein Atossa [Topomyia yanbarensis]XP_058816436.1 protein Atossa [Topomyia yanbarensis]XP_058816437.1 protein Atossa [Topomyia yanbarensis]